MNIYLCESLKTCWFYFVGPTLGVCKYIQPVYIDNNGRLSNVGPTLNLSSNAYLFFLTIHLIVGEAFLVQRWDDVKIQYQFYIQFYLIFGGYCCYIGKYHTYQFKIIWYVLQLGLYQFRLLDFIFRLYLENNGKMSKRSFVGPTVGHCYRVEIHVKVMLSEIVALY